MVESHRNEPTDEFEVCEMVGIHVASRIDLQTVIVLIGVFEQTVHRIESLVRHQEEPLPADAAVIQSLLALEYYVDAPAQLVGWQTHYCVERVFE